MNKELEYKVTGRYGTNFFNSMHDALIYVRDKESNDYKVWKEGEEITEIIASILKRMARYGYKL